MCAHLKGECSENFDGSHLSCNDFFSIVVVGRFADVVDDYQHGMVRPIFFSNVLELMKNEISIL